MLSIVVLGVRRVPAVVTKVFGTQSVKCKCEGVSTGGVALGEDT